MGRFAGSIRVARSDDIPEMHRVRVSVRENRLSDPDRVRPGDYRALLERGAGAWVVEVDGRIRGFAVADPDGANVWALFVEPAFEGRGIGRRLHETMMDWLFATGAQVAWLGTGPGTRAEAFYKEAGWRLAGAGENGERRYELSREEWKEIRDPRARRAT